MREHRQTLTETTLVAILGGGLGALIAAYGGDLLAIYGPDDVRLLADAGLNLPVFMFAMAASLVTGILCGTVPAWQCYRGTDPAMGIQEGARAAFGGRRAVRFREVLVGVEMALGTALLASAGLLLHSFIKVMGTDRGYQVERVLAVELSPSGQRYSKAGNRVAFYRELVEKVRNLQGILAVGAISDLPATAVSSDSNSRTIFYAADTNFQSLVLTRPVAVIRSITPYFSASGSIVRAGRFFTGQEQVPVALVSESLGNRLWPAENPAALVGHTFRQGDVTGPLITIVGVVEDARPGAVDRELPPIIYRPHQQFASGSMSLVVRTAQEPNALVPAIGSLPDAGHRTSDRARRDKRRRHAVGVFKRYAAGARRAPRRIRRGYRDCLGAAQPSLRNSCNRSRLAWQRCAGSADHFRLRVLSSCTTCGTAGPNDRTSPRVTLIEIELPRQQPRSQ